MDEAGRFTAEHSVMEAGIEIRELKHLLEIKDDKIKKLQASGSLTPKSYYNCQHCGKPYKRKSALNTHEQNCLNKYACKEENCGKQYVTKANLEKHVKLKHLTSSIVIASKSKRKLPNINSSTYQRSYTKKMKL